MHGSELWKTDGTETGTVMLKDINTSAAGASSSPAHFIKLNNALYFTANDGMHGDELWKTDGTDAGTVLVKDINATAGGSSNPSGFTEFNGAYYFEADDGVHGVELWKTDGTETGTLLVKDINPTPGGNSLPRKFIAFSGALYFTANDGQTGYELWKTDGTEAGTTLVKDITPAAWWNAPPADFSSPPLDFKVFNGALYFQANDGEHGYELWKTDGTSSGTVPVKDINTATMGNSPPSSQGGFTEFKGALYFQADDGVHGSELWKTDGTANGTVLVKDINASGGGGTRTPHSI